MRHAANGTGRGWMVLAAGLVDPTPLPSPSNGASRLASFRGVTPSHTRCYMHGVTKNIQWIWSSRQMMFLSTELPKMFSGFRVKTGQVMLLSAELRKCTVNFELGQESSLLQESYQNVQWILSFSKLFSGSRVQQGRTGDIICHQSYGGPQTRDQRTREVGIVHDWFI